VTTAVAIGTIEILLVEDNPGDARLAVEALKDSEMPNNLHTVGDGEEAMAYLRREGRYADAPLPSLILLDLNLPKKDGREVLAEIKGDPDLRHIPVVVMTISNSEEDVINTYNLHANCYITKPIDLEDFMNVFKSLADFWLRVVRLPSR
jgi:chemotaxis family two-component system response regulator Rcp1